jgi:hypothetical protein
MLKIMKYLLIMLLFTACRAPQQKENIERITISQMVDSLDVVIEHVCSGPTADICGTAHVYSIPVSIKSIHSNKSAWSYDLHVGDTINVKKVRVYQATTKDAGGQLIMWGEADFDQFLINE